MYYKFHFTQKPFKEPLIGQVKTDNFLKWFCENAPFGVRLKGEPEKIEQKINGVLDFSKSFSTKDYFSKLEDSDIEEEENAGQ